MPDIYSIKGNDLCHCIVQASKLQKDWPFPKLVQCMSFYMYMCINSSYILLQPLKSWLHITLHDKCSNEDSADPKVVELA